MKKLIFTNIIIFTTLILSAQVSVWDGTAEPWTHGSGTPDDPYLIESAQHLAYLAEKTNEYSNGFNYVPRIVFADTCFLLTVNLDLGADQGYIWDPIADNANHSYTVSFGGHFDGGNHSISNLTLSNYSTEFFGIFSHVKNGSLKNIIIDGADIHIPSIYSYGCGASGIILGWGENITIENCINKANVVWDTIIMDMDGCVLGGLFGSLHYSNVSNCHNYGDITAPDVRVMYKGAFCGGIAGYLIDCEINDCSNLGNVYIKGDEACSHRVNCGGIAGFATGTITNSHNNGDLFLNIFIDNSSSVKMIGGIVGYASSDHGEQLTVSNCYSVSELSLVGDMYPSWGGGMVGGAGDTIPVSVENCYYAGSGILADYTGGVVASANDNTTVTNCYYLNTISSENEYGTPKSEDEMKSEDFVSLLNTDEEMFFMDTYGYINSGYPILKWQHESHVGVDETDWNGNVSVYPNPTDGVLTINGENLKELEVVNILGQTVLKASSETDKVTVDLENHPSGIYLLKLTDAKGGKQTVKIIVKH